MIDDNFEENLALEEGNNDEFAQMLAESEKSTKSGDIVKAVIVDIKDDFVLLDTNQKTERRMPVSEIKDINGELLFKVNDNIEIIIEHNKASYKKVISKKKLKEFIESLGSDGENKHIKATVVSKNKGGYVLEYEQMQLFMPRSLSMLKSIEDNTGRTIDVLILKYDINDGILVSRKHYLDSINTQSAEKAKELLDGDGVVKCKVVKVVNFGLFVDIDGVSGLIRYNELSYKGNVNLESFKKDDEIEAKVLKFDEKRKVLELSIKVLLDNPWDKIDEQIKLGDIVDVVVENIQAYGAFVNIKGKDLDGLLHISEISWDRGIKTPADKIKVGDELKVKIIDINKEKQQLRCSLKELSEKPFEKFIEKYEIGNKVKGKVVHITDFGAFIYIDFMDCLLLNVNCSWDKGDTCKKIFKVGDEVEAIINEVDKEHSKVYLNKKALQQSPIDDFAKKYNIGDKIKGNIVNIKDFGLFVNVDNLVDVFIPTRDVQLLKIEELKIGAEVESILAEVNVKTSKVRASAEEAREDDRKDNYNSSEMKSFGDDSKITLGDVMRRKIQK
jgi:small subunit ribosomal protein S1